MLKFAATTMVCVCNALFFISTALKILIFILLKGGLIFDFS